jgi:3-dehydroquinate synthase
LASELGLASADAGGRVAALLGRLGLPIRLEEPIAPARLLGAMASDKKNRAGAIRFALPRGLGTMERGTDWTTGADESAILAALAAIM